MDEATEKETNCKVVFHPYAQHAIDAHFHHSTGLYCTSKNVKYRYSKKKKISGLKRKHQWYRRAFVNVESNMIWELFLIFHIFWKNWASHRSATYNSKCDVVGTGLITYIPEYYDGTVTKGYRRLQSGICALKAIRKKIERAFVPLKTCALTELRTIVHPWKLYWAKRLSRINGKYALL